jgi:predicted TIM-barrel fold metal-dependent hydrolase
MRIEKIDAHHHLWSVNSPAYPMMAAPGAIRFFGDTEGLKHDFRIEEFLPLAAGQNVTKSVYVESGYAPALAETAYVQSLSDRYGFPHAILARVDLAAPSARSDLKTHAANRNVRGVRLTLNWDADPLRSSANRDGLMLDEAWRRGYAALEDHGLSADLMLLPRQMAQADDLARAFPRTPIIINHGGLPLDQDAPGLALWGSGLERLAAHEHVAIKISGLGMADHRWTIDSIRPLVDRIIDIFGPERCMFASNFPVDGLHARYDAIFDAFDAITAGRSRAVRNMLFYETAARIYRL